MSIFSLRYKVRSFTSCIEDTKREKAWNSPWESQKERTSSVQSRRDCSLVTGVPDSADAGAA